MNIALLWLGLLALESFVVTVVFRDLIAGTWEVKALRYNVIPLAWVLILPFVPVCKGVFLTAQRSLTDRRYLIGLALAAAASSGSVAWLLSTGRHFENVALRAGFVGATVAFATATLCFVWPRVARLPLRARVVLAIVIGVGAWLSDGLVLPRLYPAFHWSLAAITLMSAGATVTNFRLPKVASHAASAVVFALLLLTLSRAVSATANLRHETNLRMMLVERAPLLGKAVLALSLASGNIDRNEATVDVAPREAGRSLDWSGRDLLLISVDALRADHSSLYGYNRATTPELERLAAEGMTFEYAYAPTPHTSYSITSLMTGKYMRPLVTLGAGTDSETWATLARHYGYRTAAFYPPAVFFIDSQRFVAFQDTRLGFEYAKVEFADAHKRAEQLERYLARASHKPLFAWVHLFEPHEPYVRHPDHAMATTNTPMDDYDSEIRAADAGMGDLVRAFRKERPNAVVIVTADHGEEFGDHGGRYHGTSVYEEQVRVPLVLVGPAVTRGVRSKTVVQTIDLLPTLLAAWGAPRPARIRGRDLGAVLTGKEVDEGLAYSEAEHMTLIARGTDRLVCERRLRACSLFDVKTDPQQRRDQSNERPERVRALKGALASVEASHGRFELTQALPDALRRALQGDQDSAIEVAALLDDANIEIRRKAAEASFVLHDSSLKPHLERVLTHENDETTRRFAALALVRMGDARPEAQALLSDDERAWRRRAAIALGPQTGPRGSAEFRNWLTEPGVDLDLQKELIAGLSAVRDRESVSLLVNKLDNVTLRASSANALAAIGDKQARPRLLELLQTERYIPNRRALADALITLGATKELRTVLSRFAGTPEPMEDVLVYAARAKILEPARSGFCGAGWPSEPARVASRITLAMPTDGPTRLWRSASCLTSVRVGATVTELPTSVAYVELPASQRGGHVELSCEGGEAGIAAAWIVPLVDELPPPPPEPWDGGVSDDD